MKQYTIIAACLCGCKQVSSHWQSGKSEKDAKKRFIGKGDPEWPMKILVVLKGEWETR